MNEPFYTQDLSHFSIELNTSEKIEPINLELISELVEAYHIWKAQSHNVPSQWKVKGEWDNYNKSQADFYSHVINKEIPKVGEYLQNFWRNSLGLIVKEYSTFESLFVDEERTSRFLQSLKRNYLIWKDLYHKSADYLDLNAYIGNPWGVMLDDTFVVPKAARFSHNAFQIKELSSGIEHPIVCEIGSGYGALSCYCKKYIPNVTYINVDIPETLLLAAYYVKSIHPDSSIYLYKGGDISEIDFSKFSFVFLPNYMIEKMVYNSVDVFFNSFSLSEMSLESNKAYLNEIARIGRKYFLHNNMDRKGVINRGFERIPSSSFDIPNNFRKLHVSYDPFHAHVGDYKEFLYEIL